MSTFVKSAFEDALSGILNKRTVDVLLDIKKSKQKGKPYTIVFCGVNGVGKSTNLAKIAYWLLQHNVRVMIAACDTFRAGAVEQLKTHCARLKASQLLGNALPGAVTCAVMMLQPGKALAAAAAAGCRCV